MKRDINSVIPIKHVAGQEIEALSYQVPVGITVLTKSFVLIPETPHITTNTGTPELGSPNARTLPRLNNHSNVHCTATRIPFVGLVREIIVFS